MSILLRYGALALAFAAPALPGHAQFVGGVFGPGVNDGDRTAELRFGILPENGAGDTAVAARFHYQHALNDTFRLRGVVQGRDTGDGDFDYQLFQGEAQWQIVETTPSGYSSALRFDVTLRDRGSNSVALNWTNQWNLDERWQARAILLTFYGIGDEAFDGVGLQTRTRLTYKLDNGFSVGAINFSSYGNTDAGLGGFNDQNHAIGPMASGKFEGSDWSWWAGALLGLSDGAADEDFQVRLTKSF